MKKLKLQSGGHPFVIDDLTFMQTGIMEAMAAICKQTVKQINVGNYQQSDDCCILEGIKPIITTFDITSGYAYIDGEILKVEPWTRPLNNNWSDFGLIKSTTSTFDPAGNKVYANNLSKQTYEIVKGEWALIASIPQASNYIPLEDVVGNRIFDVMNYQPKANDTTTVVNTSTPDNVIALHRNRNDNTVLIEVRIQDLAMAGAVNFTIPVGYKPLTETIFMCPMQGNADKYAVCRISTNGDMIFSAQGFTNPATIGSKVFGSSIYRIGVF